jgi:hypothetical protein
MLMLCPRLLEGAAAHGTFVPNDVLVEELTPLVEEIDQLKRIQAGI